MQQPSYLKPGDLVAIIAPARKIETEQIEFFLNIIESWGLRWIFGKNLFGSRNQFSGTDSERANDLQEAIENPDVKAIFCARGGYGTVRILNHTDFSLFEKNPKWIIGFSDITALHSYINNFLNTECIHAPMPLNIKKDHDPESIRNLKNTLFGELPIYSSNANPLNIEGSATGELAGGNLSILYSLNGTSFFPETRNKILFIEDVDEYLYHIDRMMQNLLLSGVFNRVKGVIAGCFSGMRDNEVAFGKNAEEIISETVKPFEIPLCLNFPSGHGFRNNALIFGREVQLKVDSRGGSLVFKP